MVIDWSITVGNAVEAVAFFVGGVIAFVTLRDRVKNMSEQLDDLREDIKTLNKVIVQMAVADQRLQAVEQDIRDLRRGRGFIQEEIKGEWPRRGE